ncbi:unnamed protein product [Hyaloperonospora brassicae]|uniref:RxLR effector candidate protein n=1 Tax=Hyaloperonospora brassicae TaxID=162125 RepID=A0AAV0TEY1_HYABA|nr:unnamed protein product [Hyaloperonospora brassicae]
MATTAYQLWLQKSEYKAPQPLSTRASSYASDAEVHTKLDPKTAIRTTASSPTSKKWRKLSIQRRNENAAEMKPVAYVAAGSGDVPVAGQQNPDKVATRTPQWEENEQLTNELTIPNRTKASTALRRVSTMKETKKEQWRQCVGAKSSCHFVTREEEDRNMIPIESGAMQLKQVDDGRNRNAGVLTCTSTTERLLCNVETISSGGAIGGIGSEDGHFRRSLHGKDILRTSEWTGVDSEESTTRRLSFCSDDKKEAKPSTTSTNGLPPKPRRAAKQKSVNTISLDECQYWMAVDRFSHLE